MLRSLEHLPACALLQFHKWHSELEAACASEMEEKYKRYADLLNSHLSACESILSKASKKDSASRQLSTLMQPVYVHAHKHLG